MEDPQKEKPVELRYFARMAVAEAAAALGISAQLPIAIGLLAKQGCTANSKTRKFPKNVPTGEARRLEKLH